jgi:hypothetical protein
MGGAEFVTNPVRRNPITTCGRLVHLSNQRRIERQQLSGLNSREILDFCPNLADAEHEVKKPFWRA